jgi:AcrR family transcriptional regulator
MKKDELKNEKENRLLNAGFKLFMEKDIKNTSIQDIVDEANVAKGTFYLYFKDKYELRDILIAKKSMALFSEAIHSLRNNHIENFSDQIIFVINYIVDEFSKSPLLLKFIYKNLSWGIYSKTVLKIYENNKNSNDSMVSLFLNGIKENNIKLKNPDVTLYMIVELVGSTCFNSILYNEPLPIEEFKPYLYELIKNLLDQKK